MLTPDPALSPGLAPLLPLGGDGPALPADRGRVDRARASLGQRQGVHHTEVRLGRGAEGAGPGFTERCRPSKDVFCCSCVEKARYQAVRSV